MKITKKLPRYGDKRLIKRFALFPISIIQNHIKDTRWLEFVVIEQKFAEGLTDDFWENVRFINK
jgi:hypothetical protein